MEELVKMSEKGQLVVPTRIRKNERFKASDRFIAVEIKDGVVFKRVNIPKIKIEFEAISKDLGVHLKKRRVRQSDISKAVKWARKT
ncbi:MAG: hypothetical protein KGH53_00075 [Candidatus Micrarchaeota archaeon]|nr:hypothetical protein [Candidatus Micrarchaeota archaeon]